MAEMSREEALAELNRLKEENESLKQAKQQPRSLTCKVSKSGGVSVYGLGRFPVTLYRQQWERLLGFSGDVKTFIEANVDQLSVKD